MPRLQIQSLDFSYSDKKVLDGLNLQLHKGEVFAIIGRSGSGKSTLLKCITALLEPENGNAALDGQKFIERGNITFEPWEIRQQIVIVFQDYNLFPNLTVLENITLALRKTKHLSKEDAKLVAENICEKLQIADLIKKYPNEISGGQAQRVALARAFVLKPKVLLLDEVTSAIDPSTILNVIRVIDEIKNAEETKDTAIILVTHNIRFAIDYADTIGLLHNGKIHEQHPSKTFLSEAKSDVTKDYIRDSKYFT